MADTPIPISDLPEAVPGDADYIGGSQLGNTRKFRVDQLPVPAALQAPTGSSLVGFLQSGTGAATRTQEEKSREIVTPADFTNGLSAALAAHGRAMLYGDIALTAAIEPPVNAFIRGEGASLSGYGLNVAATSGDYTLAVHDVALDTISGTGVSTAQGGTATLAADVRGLRVSNAASAVSFRNSGTIAGTIAHVRGEDLTSLGVNVGWNDYTASQNWGPVLFFDIVIRGVHPADANSHYGILTYAPFSRVIANYIEDVGSTSGADTEGIYTKAHHSVVGFNILVDAGQGEGFMNLKGNPKGDVGAPQGYNVVALGNVFHATPAYTAAAPGDVTGVKCLNDNLIVGDSLFSGFTGSAVQTTATEIDNLNVHDFIADDGAYNGGAIYLSCNGKYHNVRNGVIRNVTTGNGVRCQGQATESDITLEGLTIEGVAGSAILLKPTTGGVATYRMRRILTRAIAGTGAVRIETAKPARVEITDFDCDSTAASILSVATGCQPEQWLIENLRTSKQTTDATSTVVLGIPVDDGKALSLRVRWVGSDGTNVYVKETRALYNCAAGTLSLVGAAVDAIQEESGAVTWSGILQASGRQVLIRVQGAAATTVNWRVQVFAETV